jgi:ubiquitin-protein ligase
MHDLSEIQKIHPNELGFRCIATSDITLWKIEYFSIRKGSNLEKDIMKYKEKTGRDYLELELKFSEMYPSIPPSLRIVQPALSTEYNGTGVFCFDGLFSSIWKPNTPIDTGLVNAFNFIFNDNNPAINFERNTPHTHEEATKGLIGISSAHKEWGEASTESK